MHSSRAVTQLAREEIAEPGMPRSAVARSAPGGHDPLKQMSTWATSAWMVHDGRRGVPSIAMRNGPVRGHVAWGRLLRIRAMSIRRTRRRIPGIGLLLPVYVPRDEDSSRQAGRQAGTSAGYRRNSADRAAFADLHPCTTLQQRRAGGGKVSHSGDSMPNSTQQQNGHKTITVRPEGAGAGAEAGAGAATVAVVVFAEPPLIRVFSTPGQSFSCCWILINSDHSFRSEMVAR